MTATDLVTSHHRMLGSKSRGQFVEFHGEGAAVSATDRTTMRIWLLSTVHGGFFL